MTAERAGRPAYEPLTFAALARLLVDVDDSRHWRLVAEFLKDYRWEPVNERFSLLDREPAGTGDERWDVLLGAIAEYLAARDGRGEPGWGESRVLKRFWFPFNTRAARVDAIVHAPAAFRRRGRFCGGKRARGRMSDTDPLPDPAGHGGHPDQPRPGRPRRAGGPY